MHFDLYNFSFFFQEIKQPRRWKFMSNTTVIPHCSICFARSHSNWGHITAARFRESGASDADEPGTRQRCAQRVSCGLRRSTAVVIVIVKNRSCDTAAVATVQHCRRCSSQAPAPSLALAGSRGTTAATVQRCSTSQPHAPSLALARSRDTTAATVQRHSSSQAPAPSLALAGSRGTTAATVQRRSSSQAPAPSLALAGSRGTLATIDRRGMLDLRIALRRGTRSGMLVWTIEKSNNGLRRR